MVPFWLAKKRETKMKPTISEHGFRFGAEDAALFKGMPKAALETYHPAHTHIRGG